MRIYLDNCVINRPFDDQTQKRIRKETKAIRVIRERISSGEIDFVWSYMNEFEISQNPFEDIRKSAYQWRLMAIDLISPSISIVKTALSLRDLGIKPIDSLHIAASVEANCDYFLSTDDGILTKVKVYGNLFVRNPIDFTSSLRQT